MIDPASKLLNWKASSLLLTILGAGCVAGCVMMNEDPKFTTAPTELSFPQSKHLIERGEYHNVFILTESPTPADSARAAIPRRSGHKELLDFGLDHRLEYYNQAFHVGDGKDRYPAGADSLLYVFMEVEGDWSFVYRGVHFSIERPGRWKPAVLQRRIYARGPSRQLATPQRPHQESRLDAEGRRRPARPGGRYAVGQRQVEQRNGRKKFTSQQKLLLGEELRVGTHQIRFENGRDLLEVNGHTYPLKRGARVTIGRKGSVEITRS